MFLLNNLIDVCFNCCTNQLIITLFIAVTVFYLSRFYYLVFFSYPPGPIPLPLIGNLLLFRNYELHFNYQITKLYKKYGPVFTLWFGSDPFVFICDINLAKEAFSKADFSGRPDSNISKIFNNEIRKDILYNDYGPTWDCLRRVAHTTVKNYAKTDNLAHLVHNTVDHQMNLLKNTELTTKPFSPKHYIYNIFATIIGSSLFSYKFTTEEETYLDLKYCTTDWVQDLGNKLYIWEFVPIMRLFIKNPLVKYQNKFNKIYEFSKNIYENHIKTYDKNMERDFCDILINAKMDALNEEKESAIHLTDNNLIASLMDLSGAGVETTHTTFQWILLFIAYYPEYQQNLRNEIQSVLGDRKPIYEDRKQLHYVMAFISESLRFRNVTPLGVYHYCVRKNKIGNHSIPRGTKLVVHQYSILLDEQHWDRADEFNPDRFLDKDINYLTVKPLAFIPFSIGRRICPGEQLAYANLFLILVQFLQKTSQFEILLDNHQSNLNVLDPDPSNLWIMCPKPFKITLKIK